MKKASKIILTLLLFPILALSQEVRPVKNVIVMIPDGTSIGVYSAARWFKHYNGLGEGLNIDPYISGTVTTFSSNAPIGDSAPTGSTYATGVLQQTGNVAIHPEVSENDIYEVDSKRTYQPAATILEALQTSKVHSDLASILTDRFKKLAMRSDRAVGNNMYPNMTEVPLTVEPVNYPELKTVFY